MPRNVTQYDLLISCPGDIKDEIPLINKAVEEFNSLFSDTLGISIRTKHWSKNAYAQSGGKPQALLNQQFVRDCDAAVALFWTRFGTPTDEYGSGTEEEIEIMLESDKQVFMYFSDKPIVPSQHNPTEYAKVQEFRQKYKDRGVYFTYTSNDDFYKLFFAHLTQHFMAEKRVAEVRAERKSELILKGIDDNGKLSEIAVFQPLKLNTQQSLASMIAEIKRLFGEISCIHLQRTKGGFGTLSYSLHTPVEVNSGWTRTIEAVAKSFEMDLPEDFFCVGNLAKDTLASAAAVFGDPKYVGTFEEQKKYNLIRELYLKIIEASNWGDMENSFKGIMCVKLALCNIGTQADDEIDVTIRIPQKQLMTLDELPVLEEDTMRYLTRDCNLTELLVIPGTAEYGDYESAMNKQPEAFRPHTPPIFPSKVDYAQDFLEELRDIFGYEVFADGEEYVVKLKFDHLKHHNSVAFPAALLLKEKPEKIQYTVTSKNSSDIIEGQIEVEE